MEVFTKKSALSSALEYYREANKQVGLVPTMGALHQGHLSLVEAAGRQNDVVVVSIFVNPTQFDKAEDLEKYPRNLDADLKLLQEAGQNTLVYSPEVADLYENHVEANDYEFGGLEKEMEGSHRQGHFDGVGTVISLLFEAVKPDRAYFGEKDYQQLLIVRKLVELEGQKVEIVGCPILREPSGLAMSSRNKRLSPKQLAKASLIYQTLKAARQAFGDHSIDELTKMVNDRFKEEPDIELEYFSIARADNLQISDQKEPGVKYRGFIAAYAGSVRLIDNMALN